ncbi:MAG TPA: DnaA/Hda family protein, partial [Propionibacteriaceae bacterium]|nr:DnaA/Hda family protein [Propionibacteriaceae bacterium]
MCASSPPELRRWLNSGKPVALHADLMMVAVPNIFTRNQLEVRFRPDIEHTLAEFFGRKVLLAVLVDDSLEPGVGEGYDLNPSRAEETHGHRGDAADHPSGTNGLGPPAPYDVEGRVEGDSFRPRREVDARLNPKYTFETFVIGSSNRFAHAAAIAVAESPGKSYNPLTIYGESGLGKTHLLHALGHYVRSYFDRVRVRYVSTEELTNDFINAISQNKGVEFRRRYRDIDVLLIDDIQFLEGKEQTQEEFF